MRRRVIYLISVLVGVVLLVAVIWKVGLKPIGQAINAFSFGELFVVFSLSLIHLLITVYRWKLVLRVQGHHTAFRNVFLAKIVGFSVDYSTPSPNIGGEAVRAYVLKKETGIPFSDGLASVIIDKIMDFTYALPFVIGGIVYALISFELTQKFIIALVIVGIMFVFLLSLFYVRTLARKGFFSFFIRFAQLHRFKKIERFLEKIKHFEETIIYFFQHHKRTFYVGLFLSLMGGAVAIFQFWYILTAIGLDVTFLQAIIVATLTVITFLLPIPGSLGSQELGEAIIFASFGFGAQAGVVFSFIIRFPDIIKTAFGLGYLSHFGIKLSQGTFTEEIQNKQHEHS